MVARYADFRQLREAVDAHAVYTAKTFLEELSPRWLSSGETPRVWRGVRGARPDAFVQQPRIGGRRAKDIPNHVHLFLSASPSWRGYPAREIICTTNKYSAASYMDTGSENPYFAVSGDDAVWGVCPSGDFWDSFQRTAGGSVSDLAYFMRDHLGEAGAGPEEAARIYEKAATVQAPDGAAELPSYTHAMYPDIRQFTEDCMRHHWHKHGGSLQQWLDEALAPERNGFKKCAYAELSGHDYSVGLEVWTNQPVLLVMRDTYTAAIDSHQKRTQKT